jgi:hypothetical protein
VNKTYHVRVVRHLQFREKQRLEEGVVIEKFKTAPAEVANIVKDGDFSEFDITIHEGHKHQVRLMCHEVGHDVVRLTRIAQGPLKLDLAKPGAWRPLTGEELALLHAIGRTTARPRPVFQSNSSERRYSANRDWHSGQAPVPRDPRPRNEQGEHIGSPTGQSRTETVRPQLPARNEPSGRDVRYRPSERPPRENPAGRGERRDPAKPFVRSTGPSASKPYPKTFIGKPSFSKPKGKKPFDRSPGSKPFSRGPKPFGRTSGPRTTGRPR